MSVGPYDRSIRDRVAGDGGTPPAVIGRAPERSPLWGLLEATAPLPTEPVKLDVVDRHLLALLATDSRASQRKLARDLHMSPPAVGERISRLERLGVIRSYTVSIDWNALGYETVILAVTAGQGADQAAILRALGRLREVEEVVVVTGSMDMLARLRVRDHAHLRQVLLSEIWRIEGVQRTETFVGLAELPAKDSYIADVLDTRDASARRDEDDGDRGPGGAGVGDGATSPDAATGATRTGEAS